MVNLNSKKSLVSFLVITMLSIIIGTLTVSTLLSVEIVKKRTIESSRTDLEVISAAYETAASNYVTTRIGSLDMYIMSDIIYNSAEPEEIGAWLTTTTSRRPDVFDYVLFIGKDGNSYYDSGKKGYHGDRKYYDMIVNKGMDVVVNDPTFAKATGKSSVMIVKAAKDRSGKLLGMFVGVCPVDYLINMVKGLSVGEGSFAFMLDSQGNVIAHQDDNLIFNANFINDADTDAGIKAVAAKMISGESGENNVFEGTKDKALAIYSPVSGSKWSMAICIPQKLLNKTANGLRIFLIAANVILGVIIVTIMAIMISHSIKPLRLVVNTIDDIASGHADLTQRIELKVNNEIGSVVLGFNGFIEKLQTIISRVKDSKANLSSVDSDLQASIQDTGTSISQILANINTVKANIRNQNESVQGTATAVTEISSNIESLDRMIENQASGVTEASAAVEQMIGNISSVNQSVEKMAISFDVLRQNAANGSAKQQTVNERIEQIESQSAMLQDANSAIAAIAEQTNLLAMNAAIEAAHAGEAGKGFSVVADEIRKLSETSSAQSRTIGDQLNKIKESIGEVVKSSAESSQAFQSVASNIADTDDLVRQIKSAMEEQQEGSKQILDSLHIMSDSTGEVRNAAAEMTEGSKSILDEIARLKEASSQIDESVAEMDTGALKIRETGNALQDISQQMAFSINEIGKGIDEFKV